jgi:hypothetical protein
MKRFLTLALCALLPLAAFATAPVVTVTDDGNCYVDGVNYGQPQDAIANNHDLAPAIGAAFIAHHAKVQADAQTAIKAAQDAAAAQTSTAQAAASKQASDAQASAAQQVSNAQKASADAIAANAAALKAAQDQVASLTATVAARDAQLASSAAYITALRKTITDLGGTVPPAQ